MGLIDRDVGIGAASQFHFGATGRVGGAGAALEHASAGQQLRAVADGGHRLVGVEEMAHGGAHAFITTQILGATTAGDDQRVVVGHFHVGKRGVEREVVAGLFAIGLSAFKVVNGGLDLVAGLFVGADGVHGVADGQQCLKRHHGLVILAVVAANHQNLLACHGLSPL